MPMQVFVPLLEKRSALDHERQRGATGMKRYRVRDVMSSRVVAVSPATTFREIVETLEEWSVSAVPVVDGRTRHVVGIVSETDLLHERPGRHGRTAADLMSAPPITVRPDATLSEAARLAEAAGVKRLPVVDDDKRLVGIVGRRDLLRIFLRHDDDIRHDVESVVRRLLWSDAPQVAVTTHEGVVTLTGSVARRTLVELAVMLAWGVDGVVDVASENLAYDVDDRAAPL
jgi:CBS domain-containing protein